ncbi:MAG: hypothetical protein A2091_08160 [Desulfuromonadales bacterium GWD2_61_12]|nr:MAG: hypothetical protein A2005_01635 [Desulfuromonadales bacterium GWC2_61_20]OGR35810.1 MAG: hypothetical protein A2091_08160 [Desulfuromonadales bacterium GWD2_61_12]
MNYRKLCQLALYCSMLLATPVLAAGPQLVAEQSELSFGEVFQGEKVERVFLFRNAGDAPLLIERVKSSCGCTAALVSSSELAPGATGELRAVFDSARFSGEVQKSIYLYTNDPARPMGQFVMRGTVRQEVTIVPPLADLGEVKAGATKEVRLVLTNQGKETIPLYGVDVLAPDLTAELAATAVSPGASVELRLKSAPGAERKRLNGYLLVKTGSGRVPELRVPVYGSVVAPAGTAR